MAVEPIGRAGELLYRYLATIPDFDALERLLHPDVSVTVYMPSGRRNTGRERILRGLRREFHSFYRPKAFQLQVLEAFGDDERAAARFTITADTARGPYFNNYAIVARFAGGLLVEAWEYVDSASAARQLAPETDGLRGAHDPADGIR